MYIILVKMVNGEQFILTRTPKEINEQHKAEVLTFFDIYLIIHFVNEIIYSRGEGYYALLSYIAIVKMDMKVLKAPNKPQGLLKYLVEPNIYQLLNDDVPYLLHGIKVKDSIKNLDTGINILEERVSKGLNQRKNQLILPQKYEYADDSTN